MADLKFVIGATDHASKVLGNVGDSTDKLRRKTDQLKEASRLMSAGAIIAFGVSSVKAYAEAEAQQVKLQEAYRKFPAIASVSIDSMRELNSAIQAKTGTDDDELAAAEAKLAMYNLTGEQIQKLIPVVNDFAVAQGITVTEAAGKVGKAMMGNARALKDVGVDFKATGDKAKDFETILGALEGKVGGAGEAFGKTTAGQIKILQASFSDLQEEVGAQLVPALQALVGVVTPIARSFGSLPEPVKATAVAIGAMSAAALIAGPRILALSTALSTVGASATGSTAKLALFTRTLAGVGVAAAAAVAAIGALGEANKALQDALGNGAKSAEQWGDSLKSGISKADLQQLKIDMAGVAGQSGAMAGALEWMKSGDIIGAWTAWRTGGENVANFDKAMANLVASGNMDTAAALVGALGLSAGEVRDKLPEYASAVEGAEKPTAALAGAAMEAAENFADFGNVLDSGVDKAKLAADTANALKQALDELGGKTISANDATAGLEESYDKAAETAKELKDKQDELGKAVTKGGASLDLSTEAGRKAHEALKEIATSADTAAAAYSAAGMSTAEIEKKTATARAEFIKAARQMGISEDAAGDLADAYGLIPGKVRTTIENNAAGAVRQAVINYIASLNNIPEERRTQIITEYITEGSKVSNQPGSVTRRAGGGVIYGAGTETSDSIPAMLSNGEYVVRAAAVKRFGIGALNDINADGVLNRVAKFAAGGPVTPQQRLANFNASIRTLKDEILELRNMVKNRAGGIAGTASLANSFDWGAKPGALADQADAIKRVSEAQEALNQANRARNTAGTPEQVAAAIAAQARAEGELAAAKADRAKADAAVAAAQPTAGNLLAGMKSKLAGIKDFYKNLKDLKKRGLPAGLLTQLLDAGPVDGADMAKALVAATPAEFKDILATQKDIDTTSSQIAYNIDPLIGAQRRVVENAAARASRDQVLVSQVALKLDSKQVAEALVQYRRAMGGRGLGLG